jgi:cation-transporting ATPase I
MRTLCRRGAVVLRSAPLRLLDRVDTLLLDRARSSLDAPPDDRGRRPAPGVAREQVVQRAGMLFDGATCSSSMSTKDWRLGPAEPARARPPPRRSRPASARSAASTATSSSPKALIFAPSSSCGPRCAATPRRCSPAVRRARLHFVLASDDPRPRARTSPSTSACPRRRCRVRRPRPAARRPRRRRVASTPLVRRFAAADVGIGVVPRSGPPPWSADLLLAEELCSTSSSSSTPCTAAREVAEQSVVLAGVGAALGAALALGGLRKTKPQQVMLATHAASVIALANGLRKAHGLVAPAPPPAIADPTPWHRLDRRPCWRASAAAKTASPEELAAPRAAIEPAPAPAPGAACSPAVGQELRQSADAGPGHRRRPQSA